MADETAGRHRGVGSAFSWGPMWCAGWLFTIGLAHLSFWKAVLGIIIWPYFLGKGLG